MIVTPEIQEIQTRLTIVMTREMTTAIIQAVKMTLPEEETILFWRNSSKRLAGPKPISF